MYFAFQVAQEVKRYSRQVVYMTTFKWNNYVRYYKRINKFYIVKVED